MEYYSAIKRNEMPFGVTQIYLEIVILNKVSLVEKDKYHVISVTCGILKDDTNEPVYKTESLM